MSRRKEGDLEQLRRENQELRRKISRLKKQLERAQAEPVEEPDDGEGPPPAKKGGCPLCGSPNIGSYVTPGGKRRMGCKECRKWKG